MTCYSCGSSLVGEVKFKQSVDGSKRRHVYYHCSRQVDYNCREPYAREEDIVEELSRMCNELITDIRNVKPNLRMTIDRFARMMTITHTEQDQQHMIGAYIKYVLHDGTLFEKTRLIRNLDVRLALHERKLVKL